MCSLKCVSVKIVQLIPNISRLFLLRSAAFFSAFLFLSFVNPTTSVVFPRWVAIPNYRASSTREIELRTSRFSNHDFYKLLILVLACQFSSLFSRHLKLNKTVAYLSKSQCMPIMASVAISNIEVDLDSMQHSFHTSLVWRSLLLILSCLFDTFL